MNEYLEKALAYLNELIAQGVEFPDALYRVTQLFTYSAEELTQAYDEQQAQGRGD